MTYLDHITTYVVSLLGKGVTLSSGDLDVVKRWEGTGVPAEVACRTIRRQWRRQMRQTRRLSLADCRLPEANVLGPIAPDSHGAAPKWTQAELLDQIVALGRATGDASLKAVYRKLYSQLQALPEAALSLSVLARLDALAVRELERQLPAHERREQRRQAKARAVQAAGREATKRAVERLACALLEEQYCEVYGLTLPSDLLTSTGPH